MTAPGPATSGIADLDRTLGGLFWGDNVVWEVRRHASVEPFVRALVSAGGQAEAFAHVSFGRRAPPQTPGSRSSTPPPTARTRGRASCSRPCAPSPGAPSARSSSSIRSMPWPSAGALRSPAASSCAAARCCSRSAPSRTGRSAARTALAGLRREVEQVTQCVLVVDDHRVRIAKADGRPPGVEGSVLSLSSDDDGEISSDGDACGRAARDCAAQPARAPRAQPDRPRAPGRRVAERDLARRARPVRPLARHAARPLGSAQRHARRVAARRRRARLPAGPPPRSRASAAARACCRCWTISAWACACSSLACRRAPRASPTSATRASRP